MNIAEKLLNIQCELKAPKNQYNSFGRYKYRSLEDITEALKPLLLKYNCVLIISDEMVEIGGRVYVKSTSILTDGENPVSVAAYAREPASKKGMDEAQITGATSSYARKYCLNGLFAIDDTKDADYSAPKVEEKNNVEPFDHATNDKKSIYNKSKKLTAAQLKYIEDLIKVHDVNIPKFMEYYKIDRLLDLAPGEFDNAVVILKGRPLKNE